MTNPPNPGSKEAQEAGCKCPVAVPNNPGQTLFYAPNCPLHGTPIKVEPETN